MGRRCCSRRTSPSSSVPLADRVVSMGGGRVTGEEPGGRRVALAAVPATVPGAEPGTHGGDPCGMTQCWSRARTSGSRRVHGSACGRSCPSPSWSWCSSPSPSGPTRPSLRHAAPGLFWVAVLFSTVLAIQRSVAVESGEGTRDGLRLSGIDPAGIFLGKAAAVGLQLLAAPGRPVGRRDLPLRRAGARRLAGRDGLPAGHRRPGLRRGALRRPLGRPAGARHAAARCWSCPSWPRSCWPAPRPGRPRSTGNAPSGTQWLQHPRSPSR